MTETSEERIAHADLKRGSRELARRIAMTGKAHGPCDETALILYVNDNARADLSPRQLAIKSGAISYEGKECSRCGRTERLVSNADCRHCTKHRKVFEERKAAENALAVQYAQARRKAQALGNKRYEGRACGTCGGTERYTKNNTCCACQKDATLRCKSELSGAARVDLERVATEFGVPMTLAMSKTTDRRIVAARHAMWAQLRHRGYSFPKIAALFKVDHSTVQAAVRKVMGIAA